MAENLMNFVDVIGVHSMYERPPHSFKELLPLKNNY